MSYVDADSRKIVDYIKEVAKLSPDPSTQCGCLIVQNGSVVGEGWNDFPNGVEATHIRLNNRDVKLRYMIHAEVAAILSLNTIKDAEGADLYVYPLRPCLECAKLIIEAGIKRVFVYEHQKLDRWSESQRYAQELFDEVGVEVWFK
jgi:dCMP deaminase